jgi:hypothetical protein
VPDLHTRETVAPWLEAELLHQLRPVAAPPGLWNRINPCQQSDGGIRLNWILVPVTGIIALLTTAILWQVGLSHGPATDIERFTEQELQALAGGSGEVDFRSNDPDELKAWIKTRMQMDVELPSGRSALLGVRLVRLSGAPVAAIAYRAGTGAAMLLVTKKRNTNGNSRHLFAKTRLVTWNMQDQTYTAAISNTSLGNACFLCHAHGVF